MIALGKRGALMTGMISYCGLPCDTCPIYLASRQENKEEQIRSRTEIARLCREQYGVEYTAQDITDCDGCRTEGGRLFSGCINCRVRQCAHEKKVENCARCADYVCAELARFLIAEPAAKKRLEALRDA